MSDYSETTLEQAAAFQKIWQETLTKLMQSAFTLRPESAPPEVLREIRSGIFQALGRSWEEFLRSPQFLESMKQWMDQAVAWRKMSNDLMANLRSELQEPSREDIDTIMLAVRHMEKRLLDRVEDMAAQLEALSERLGPAPGKGARPGKGRLGASPAGARKPSPGNGKVK
jgi:hypothetical protein